MLRKNGSESLKVYAVWLPMLGPDDRTRVRTSLLDDFRVRQFWDGDRIVGSWFGRLDGSERTAWDVFFAYGPDAAWDERPGPLEAWGFPIIQHTDKLVGALRKLKGAKVEPSTEGR